VRRLAERKWRLLALLVILALAACEGDDSVKEPPSTPICDLLPDTLDFQRVAIGASRDLAFTIANKGGGTLAGSVSEACDDFTVMSGGGAFSLAGGQSRAVSVRFAPARTGASACTVQTGADCGRLICRGQGIDPPPLLEISADTLEFGAIEPGQSATRSFTVKNAGGGTLDGTVSASCADFVLVAGQGDYALASGEIRTVSVRFAPSGCGPRSCAVTTGPTPDTDVACFGVGGGLGCSLSTPAIDFGSVGLGSHADRSFTITNTGCEGLNGRIASNCGAFAVVSGGGDFTLVGGQSRQVTVRFTPSRCGSVECILDLGHAACPEVACAGAGTGGFCAVEPPQIDFGSVSLGATSERIVLLRNDGCATLSGTVSADCPEFAIALQNAAYALQPGESLAVPVRFTPQQCYTRSCAIDMGNDLCGSLACVGSGTLADCFVSPTRLDFGSVAVGQFADLTFTITNRGCDALIDSVAMTCRDFTLVSGGGSYSLAPGAMRSVTVRFRPSAAGARTCTIDAGFPACVSVSCLGTGVGTGPGCRIEPTSLDFGSLAVWESADRSFTITNSGTSALSGTVSESCPEYEIVAGLGSYTLAPGGSRQVTVRFTPVDCGTETCLIETGNAICADVGCTGSAGGEGCSVSATTLDFGTVPIGESADLIFQILNDGCDPLEGTPSESCPDFEIVGGGGFYSIPSGQFRNVTLRFTPSLCGAAACTIETGNDGCADVACAGLGGGGGCILSPSGLDFGVVELGGSAELDFTIKNDGCAAVAGSVTESCTDYEIVAGGGQYSLENGDSVRVVVRFAPQGCGTRSCLIETGNPQCPDLSCAGSGGGTGCVVSTESIDFGSVSLGQWKDLSFTITNEGCGSIAGVVSEACDDYRILSGDGSYNLSLGQSRTVTVRFEPTACGTRTCTIETGSTICSDVSCAGMGGGSSCGLSTTSLDFGTVAVGEVLDRGFTITNSGCAALTGSVSETCDDYEIASGAGDYALNPGQSRAVTVRFRPTECGAKACTIETGNSLCSDVSCSGAGGGSLCSVSPTTLDFGTIAVGSSVDRSFTITNAGCTSWSGTVAESCVDYDVVSGGGFFTLAAGAQRQVTVRFAPTSCGPKNCGIDTGSALCADVQCAGVAAGIDCDVDPTALDFGTVAIGLSDDRSFTITNTGCEPLAGSVSEDWPDYEIIAPGGAFNLAAGQTRNATVRFTPTVCGQRTCAVQTGQPLCSGVSCVGIGSFPSPVIVHPVADAMVSSGFPDSTGCAVILDRVGWDTAEPGELRTLLRFDLSAIPAQATVLQARLDLFADGCLPPPPDTTLAVYVSRIDGSWSECGVTWNTIPAITPLACSYALGCGTPHLYSIECSPLIPLVQQWIGTPSANRGILLQPSAVAVDGAVNIRSHRFGTDPPTLRVWFSCP